jgi:hypothetical protein
MDKKIFVKNLGLAMYFVFLSLFPSTAAWAQKTGGTAAAQGPQQVVVSNTTAQPVPVVGLIKDSDLPARKPFQWYGTISQSGAGSNAVIKVTTVPANQRLVIEYVSGYCQGGTWILGVDSYLAAKGYGAMQYFPPTFWNGSGPGSTPFRFYVDPGYDLNFTIGYNSSTNCNLTMSGYYVDLP